MRQTTGKNAGQKYEDGEELYEDNGDREAAEEEEDDEESIPFTSESQNPFNFIKAVKEGTALEQAQRYICNRAAGVCKKKPPPLKERKFDEKFQPMTADEKQMQDMQARRMPPPPRL